MKTVAGLDVELTVEERNLLSVAYKNVIGQFFSQIADIKFNILDNRAKEIYIMQNTMVWGGGGE